MDLKVVVLVVCALACVDAMPRYIAVPLENIRFVRMPRSVQAPVRYYPAFAQDRSHHEEYEQQYQEPQQPRQYQEPQQPRQYEEPQQYEAEGDHYEAEASDRYERSGGYGHGHANDHVDYGAYTGGYGAFGWYSDHPVCINCGYGHH